MGRSAQVWKNQANLTDLGMVTDQIKVEDQLRVRIALRTMRKAHTQGSRSDREKEKLERLRKRTIAAALKMSRKKDSDSDEEPESHRKDDAEELLGNAKQRQSFYSDQEPISMKTIDQIKKDAMVSFQLTKDRIKIQNEAKKYGQLRPICADVIQEVKEQEEQRLGELRRRKLCRLESNKKATWSPAPNLNTGSHTKSTATGTDSESEHSQKLFRVVRRHDLLPTKMTAPFTIHSMPAAEQLISLKEEEEIHQTNTSEQLIATTESSFRRPSSASAAPLRTDSDSIIMRAEATSSWDQQHPLRPYSASMKRASTLDTNNDMMRRTSTRPPLGRLTINKSGSQILFPQGYQTSGTSGFVARVVDQDEKILRALKAKEDLLHAKEERILKKIHDKEESAHNRQVQQFVQERMKSWLSLVELLTRLKFWSEQIHNARLEQRLCGNNASAKEAIHIIKKWWKKYRVVMKLWRHPKYRRILRRTILMYANRLRLRRKRKAATLIKTFLEDCSGLSETMRKVYFFRQSVIKMQRWVRSWMDCQVYRVRLLWMAAEKKAKEAARAERINKLKNERSALKAMEKMSGFAEAMSSINRRRRELSKVLEYQEDEGAKRREDLVDQMEALEVFKKQHEEELKQRVKATNTPAAHQFARKASMFHLLAPQIHQNNNNSGLPRTASNLNHNKPVNGGFNVIGNTNYIFLQVTDRSGANKGMEYWMKKVRTNAQTMKTYELLRYILQQQRRRHLLDIRAKQTRRTVCPVELEDLQKFLKDPKDNSMSQFISHSIGDTNPISVMASDLINSPFLLLTQGGLEAIDVLLKSNKGLKFY